jgi:hypothetical protein
MELAGFNLLLGCSTSFDKEGSLPSSRSRRQTAAFSLARDNGTCSRHPNPVRFCNLLAFPVLETTTVPGTAHRKNQSR